MWKGWLWLEVAENDIFKALRNGRLRSKRRDLIKLWRIAPELIMRRIFCTMAILILMTPALQAQDISGDWQGALGTGKDRLRIVLHVDKDVDGGWKATVFSIDQGPDGIPVTSITQHGAEVSFSIAALKLSYKGRISSDTESIVGKLTQDGTGSFTFVRPTKQTAWPRDIHCACSVSFVPAAVGVKLEVLDWGGTGRPLVLLAGLGDTAHGFDTFAQKLTAKYHVYGITRRGFGESSSPPPTEANYSADRLGDDVLAVIGALHLQQPPVLAGHSIAGEELSSVGSRHPEKVAGLVFLDAAYEYAFYNPAYPDPGGTIDALTIRKKIEDTILGPDTEKAISELLADLPEFEKTLREQQKALAGVPSSPPDDSPDDFGPEEAIRLGERKYTHINVPVLAIFANPRKLDPMPQLDAAGRAALAKNLLDHTTSAIKSIEAGVPSAHVVVIPNADHYVFQSNEAQVLKEMDAFISRLPN